MLTVDQVKLEIVDYLNKSHHAKYDTFELKRFGSAFYSFLEDIGYSREGLEFASGTAKVVEYIDAGEGDYSAETRLVFSLNGQLFRVDGRYESWDGSEWEADAMYEVEPVPVIVTQYQRKV